MRLIGFIFVGLILLSGCGNNNNKEYLIKIDNLINELDIALEQYNKVDSITVSEIRKTVSTNCSAVKKDENPDVMTTFIYYSHIDKSMKQILRLDARIRNESETSKKQLEDLYHDASKNLINKQALQMHYSEEENIVKTLIERMEYNTGKILTETQRFDSLNPIIESHLKKTK